MPDDRSEIVEIFEFEHDVALDEPDEVTQGGERPPVEMLNRWSWWRRNDGVTKFLTLTGLAGVIVAVFAGYGAMTAAPGTQYFVNQTTVPAPAITVDALGCPRDATCVQRATPTALSTAILRVVPSGRVSYALQTVDVGSGRVYRREIDLTAPKTTMRFVSQCVPGAGAVTGQPMTLTVDTGTGPQPRTPNDPTFSGRKRLVQLVPGRPGCSLFAEGNTTLATYELDGQSVDELLTLVANDPAMMVTP